MIRKNTAVLIIDVQAGSFMEHNAVFKGDELLDIIRRLITQSHREQVPVFLTQHNGKPGTPIQKGTPGWALHPSLPLSADDTIIQKDNPDSFQETDLGQHLKSRQICRIILAGLLSEVCVDATCRRAFSEGYEVVLVKDGHSTYDAESLTAGQITHHHNDVLGQWFATLAHSDEILLE